MLYFKTIGFPEQLAQPQVETALRRSAIKKTVMLDFKSAIIDVNRDKDFLGFDRKNDLVFTRTKSSLALLLPKMIISLPKQADATVYKVRLGALPFSIFMVLGFGTLTTLTSLFKSMHNLAACFFFLAATTLFLIACALELKYTKVQVANRIKKAYSF